MSCAQSLEERLARRRYMAALHNHDRTQQRNEVEHRKETNDKMLTSLVGDGKMTDKQKEELLKQYDADVMRVQLHHEQGALSSDWVPRLKKFHL